MVLTQKCTGCGRIYGEKGTERNGGISGGACKDCEIRRIEIVLQYVESFVESFPYDPNWKKWVKRVSALKPELKRLLIQRQEADNKKMIKLYRDGKMP